MTRTQKRPPVSRGAHEGERGGLGDRVERRILNGTAIQVIEGEA